MENQKTETKSVPLLIYESEMRHKTNIIKGLLALMFMFLAILGITFYLFVSFLDSYNFVSYEQDGNGINNVNSGSQGDLINESTLTNDD